MQRDSACGPHDTQHNDTQRYDTQHNDTQHNNILHNDTQHNNKKMRFSKTALEIKYYYAECRLYRTLFMLGVEIEQLMLTVIMLTVIMISNIVINVVAPIYVKQLSDIFGKRKVDFTLM
jgi:hypothetical protein